MANLNVSSATYGNALTTQSNNLTAAVAALSDPAANGDPGALLTTIVQASANISLTQTAASKEREMYKALEQA